MYHSTGVQKLSETQKSKLRNGHPVRIKKGEGNNLHLTDDQIKKLESASKKGVAYTLTMHPGQAAKHESGEDLFGDIAAKARAFARKHKDLINPIIGRVRPGAKSGIDKLDSKTNTKVDEYIKPIEGEGIIGHALKSLVSMSVLGVKPKTLKSTLSSLPSKKPRKGKGILSSIAKAVGHAIIDAAANAAKGKVEGMGEKRYPGRPEKAPKSTTKKGPGRPRKNRSGGSLFPADNYGPSD
jgi:hypothetical protein